MTEQQEQEKHELFKQLEIMKHEFKMEEIKYIRETERMKHEWEKERMRIKSAEIQKSQLRRWKDGSA